MTDKPDDLKTILTRMVRDLKLIIVSDHTEAQKLLAKAGALLVTASSSIKRLEKIK